MASGDEDDVINVRVIHQDPDWGGGRPVAPTSIATSDKSASRANLANLRVDDDDDQDISLTQLIGRLVIPIIVGLLALITPLIFIILPIIMASSWKTTTCGNPCNNSYLALAMKELILIFGIWALYIRRSNHYSLPRIVTYKLFLLLSVVFISICYWVYFILAMLVPRADDYASVVYLAVSLVDIFLFLHYVSLILLEIRRQGVHFVLKVVRDPDGECRYYNAGRTSYQVAALTVLQNYYRDFPTHNSAMERAFERFVGRGQTSLTVYNIDGRSGDVEATSTRSRSVITASTRRGGGGAANANGRNERYYNETEFYTKIGKRRARLIASAEDAFMLVKQLHQESTNNGSEPKSPYEMATAVFPGMARQLQKYLRATKQQTWYNMQAILKHLSQCIALNTSSKTFLQPYLSTRHCAMSLNDDHISKHSWSMETQSSVSDTLQNGGWFVLKRNDITLIVSVVQLPFFQLTSSLQGIDLDGNRYFLNDNAETSV